MRICIVVRVLWPGGVQTIAFGEAKSLSDRGHSVDLVFLRDSGRGEHPWSYLHQYRVLYDPEVNVRPLHRLLWMITRRYASERGEDATVDLDLIKKFERTRQKYDVLIYFDQMSSFFAKLGGKLHGDKFVVNVMETWYKRGGLIPHYVERRGLRNAAAILTIGKKNLELITSHGFKNSYLLYPGTFKITDPPQFSDRKDFAISVTMWDRGRHPEKFLTIASKLTIGRIFLIGDWTDPVLEAEFKSKVYSMGLQERLTVAGRVSRLELEGYLRIAKVMIRFGYEEFGPGMGSLEALSYGLPLVVNRNIGIHEIIESYNVDPSLVVDETDLVGVAKKVDEILVDENLWTTKSRSALVLAELLSWKNHGKRLEEILNETVKH